MVEVVVQALFLEVSQNDVLSIFGYLHILDKGGLMSNIQFLQNWMVFYIISINMLDY